MLLKLTQGVEQKIRVYSQNSILILKNSTTILTFNNVVADQNDDLFLTFTIDQDNYIEGGIANYQLFESNQLKEYGTVQIIPSLLVNQNQDIRGRYKVIVEAIQAQLAGVASSANKHVQVGDKTIDKYSAYELLKLLDYFQGKLAEEESGTDINTKTDQMNIKYVWRVR